MPDITLEPDRSRLLALAQRYVWWSARETTLRDDLPRLVAQVMEMGTWEDAHELLRIVGPGAFADVLRAPPPGLFSPRSWAFWHIRLRLGEPPPLPRGRNLPRAGSHAPRP
jgi:hypothetical protein